MEIRSAIELTDRLAWILEPNESGNREIPVTMRGAEIAKIPFRVAAIPAGLRSRLTIENEHAALHIARCRRRGESPGGAGSFDFALVLFLY